MGERLAEVTPAPLQRVFLCDSGSVAVEVALKMALQFWRARGVEGRTRMLTVRGGYHGDTFGAMGVCDPINGMHAKMFGGVLAPHLFAPRLTSTFGEGEGAPSVEADAAELGALLEAHREEVAAVILEPIVQGAGGMRLYSPAYLRRVRELCDQHWRLVGKGLLGRLSILMPPRAQAAPKTSSGGPTCRRQARRAPHPRLHRHRLRPHGQDVRVRARRHSPTG